MLKIKITFYLCRIKENKNYGFLIYNLETTGRVGKHSMLRLFHKYPNNIYDSSIRKRSVDRFSSNISMERVLSIRNFVEMKKTYMEQVNLSLFAYQQNVILLLKLSKIYFKQIATGEFKFRVNKR